MPLTVKEVQAATALDREFLKLYDGNGLFLFVSKTGRKFWRLKYSLNGKSNVLSLGEFPNVSLSDARKMAHAAKLEISDGKTPKSQSLQRKKTHLKTFEAVACEYWESRSDISEGYRKDALNAMRHHIIPFLGSMPIAEIDKSALLEVLKKVNAQGKFSYVRKLRTWCGLIFDFAEEFGYSKHNPARQINANRAFGKREVEHFSALNIEELPQFFYALSLEKDQLMSVMMLKMIALTWCRTAEVRGMRWDEINFNANIWEILSERMKKRRAHIVPLSNQAIAILHTLKMFNRGGVLVFEGARSPMRALSENTVLALISRIGYAGKMTGHGFRSIASTWANSRGYNVDAIELALAHVPENKTRAAYNRHDYVDARRKMLQDYADFLETMGMKP